MVFIRNLSKTVADRPSLDFCFDIDGKSYSYEWGDVEILAISI